MIVGSSGWRLEAASRWHRALMSLACRRAAAKRRNAAMGGRRRRDACLSLADARGGRKLRAARRLFQLHSGERRLAALPVRVGDCRQRPSATCRRRCRWCPTAPTPCGHSIAQLSCSPLARVEHAHNCPIAPAPGAAYVDIFARTRATPFIAAANAHDRETVRQKKRDCGRDRILSPPILADAQLPSQQFSRCRNFKVD